MIMEPNKVNVNWTQNLEKDFLKMEIHGRLDEENATKAISKWKEELSSNLKEGEKANVICNCLHMTGYDTEARRQWQQAISDLKHQIEYFWVITDNKMIKIAANTMGLMTNFKIKTAKSETEIL